MYYYVDNKADVTRPIFKLPFSNLWMDRTVFDYAILHRAKTIYLFEKEKHPIGSSFGISQTHGEVYPIYTGFPIFRDIAGKKSLSSLHDLMKGIIPSYTDKAEQLSDVIDEDEDEED